MIGIYKITNQVNKKVYIGQSVDIIKRYQEHLRAGQPDKYSHKNDRDIKTPLHLAIQKYGVENFSLTILEECLKEELNDKEKYWITKYQSNNQKYGYNIQPGGHCNYDGSKGELHGQAKLTQQQVNEIKNILKSKQEYSLQDIQSLFPFISKSTISMINQGKIWFNDKEKYPIRQMSTANKGSKNGNSKLTEEQVIEIRTLYSKGKKPKDIYQIYQDIVSYSNIQSILYGKTFKHLPIWDNKKKNWIEPCIDYPQSLKQAGE